MSILYVNQLDGVHLIVVAAYQIGHLVRCLHFAS